MQVFWEAFGELSAVCGKFKTSTVERLPRIGPWDGYLRLDMNTKIVLKNYFVYC